MFFIVSLKEIKNMEKSGKQQNEKVTELKTFPVPFDLGKIKENITINTITPSKQSKEKIINQAFKFHSQGNISEASKYYQYFINEGFRDHRVFSNYSVILKTLGKFEEAEILQRKAIKLNPDFANAHSNLGMILKALGKLEEAELSLRKAIKLNSNFAEAKYNLGIILSDLGKLEEAELAQRKAIELNPNFAEAYSNLGNILNTSGKLKEAELAQRKAIELNPNLANAHSNLGNILRNISKLKEAELSYKKAIELNPNVKEYHRDLSICLYLMGNKSAAINSMINADSLNQKDKDTKILLNIFKGERKNENLLTRLDSNPLILNRPVEIELIECLYKFKARDQEKYQGPTYGNARGSDYALFKRNDPMIKIVKKDLTTIGSNAVKSDIYICDSFFTIFRSGGGLISHTHITEIDKIKGLDISMRKFSLVYYLSVGDQNCDEPGILKLEDPNENILPNNGMIIIFPANRKHSVFYKGQIDRVIIGINFYIT
tara:strand:- start:575 stop:2044 length:1470 start_codon:yes stop_codon:yes gene_type:complete